MSLRWGYTITEGTFCGYRVKIHQVVDGPLPPEEGLPMYLPELSYKWCLTEKGAHRYGSRWAKAQNRSEENVKNAKTFLT